MPGISEKAAAATEKKPEPTVEKKPGSTAEEPHPDAEESIPADVAEPVAIQSAPTLEAAEATASRTSNIAEEEYVEVRSKVLRICTTSQGESPNVDVSTNRCVLLTTVLLMYFQTAIPLWNDKVPARLSPVRMLITVICPMPIHCA